MGADGDATGDVGQTECRRLLTNGGPVLLSELNNLLQAKISFWVYVAQHVRKLPRRSGQKLIQCRRRGYCREPWLGTEPQQGLLGLSQGAIVANETKAHGIRRAAAAATGQQQQQQQQQQQAAVAAAEPSSSSVVIANVVGVTVIVLVAVVVAIPIVALIT